MTIVTAEVSDITGRPDNTRWEFLTPVRVREGSVEGSIITNRTRLVQPLDGSIRVELDPGPATIKYDGNEWEVTIPEEDSSLWDIISAAVAVPPDTALAMIGSAVSAWLQENPPSGDIEVDNITDSGAAGRAAVQADTAADLRAAAGGSTVGAQVFTAEDEAAGREALGAADARGVGLIPAVVGDGVVNATTAFQAVIDATPVNPLLGVAVVQVPDGQYKVTSSLIPKSDLLFQGLGENAVIDFTAPSVSGDNLFDYSAATLENFTLRNLTLLGEGYDAGGGTDSGVAVRVASTTVAGFKAENLTVRDFRYGIHMSSSSGVIANPIIKGGRFYGCSYAAIRVRNTTHATISDNFVDCTRAGIGDETPGRVGIWCAELSTGSLGHLDTIVANNHVFGADAECINVHSKYATVTGNTVSGGESGIMFEPFIMTSPGESDAKMVSTIAGNTARDCTQCIVVRHDPINNVRASGQVAITGNATSGGNVGIRVGQDTTADYGPFDVSVTGNVCVGHGTRAIRLIDARRVTLAGNIAEGVDCGLSIESDTKIVSVAGGSYRGTGATGDGIRIEGAASYITMSAVTVDNVARYGVFITGTTDYITINGLIALDDQGSPTMDNAVFSNTTGTNLVLGGGPLTSGATGADYSGIQPLNVQSGVYGARAATPGTYRSGYYYFASGGAIGTASLGNENLRVSQWIVTEEVSIARFNAEYTVAGQSGSVFRIGVWAADGAGGIPSTLVLDAGTIATDGTPGVVEITLGSPVTIPPGVYWIGGAVQNASSTQPTMRTVTPLWPGGPLTTSLPSAGATASGWLKAAVSGAFGAFTSPGTSSNVPRIGFKVA